MSVTCWAVCSPSPTLVVVSGDMGVAPANTGMVPLEVLLALLPAVCECLRLLPCTAAARRAMDGVVRMRNVQHTACWAVQWLLLLLQVALVGTRGREQEAGPQGEAGRQGEAGPGVAAAWRRQLLDKLDVVGTLCGVVRLLATYPRVRLEPGPGEEQQLLRALLPPGALAACLDAAAAAFPHEVHGAFCGPSPAAGHGQSQGGQGGGGGNDRALAARRCVRLLLGKGGPLELDGGAWVGSEGSCFWRVLTGGLEGAGEAREAVVREAAERAGHLPGGATGAAGAGGKGGSYSSGK